MIDGLDVPVLAADARTHLDQARGPSGAILAPLAGLLNRTGTDRQANRIIPGLIRARLRAPALVGDDA